jgi:polar amino acid transport system substrate-binding protein
MKKLFVVFFILLAAGIAVTYWWFNRSPSIMDDPVIARIKKSGKLVVATDPTYPPMESVNTKGQIVGLDVDIAREIAKAIGVPLDIKKITWDATFPEVVNGDVDMMIASTTITPEREKIVLFSNPYFESGQVIVVRDTDESIHGPKDIAHKRVAAQKDSTGGTQAALYVDPKLISWFEINYDSSVSDLIAGRVDALIVDYPAGEYLVQTTKGLKLAGDPFTSEFYGILMKKGNTGLATFVNSVIKDIKTSGRFDQIKKQWFP